MDGGINTFSYVENNPFIRYDLKGQLFGFDDIFTGPVDEIIVFGGLSIAAAFGSEWAQSTLDSLSDIFQNKGFVPLYRVVDDNELASVLERQKFSILSGGFGEKQFWVNLADARWFASATLSWSPTGSLTIVQIGVSESTLNKGAPFSDSGHPAVSYNSGTLPYVNADIGQYGGVLVLEKF